MKVTSKYVDIIRDAQIPDSCDHTPFVNDRMDTYYAMYEFSQRIT